MVQVSETVARELEANHAVVALESTIFSELGLPSPANAQAYRRCVTAIRETGATPALTVVLDGVARVGIDDADSERICGPAQKMAARDIAVAVGMRWDYGASTVSAALRMAAAAQIGAFRHRRNRRRASRCRRHG